ncbi:MAG: sialidase family protein [Christensenellales bacterium]
MAVRRTVIPVRKGGCVIAEISERTLFRAGEGGYHTYRIPALAYAADGSLLALCEGRRDGQGDSGAIDILARRSADRGATWGPARVVVRGGGDTAGNPAPVVDGDTGFIHMLFCMNRADRPEPLIHMGRAPRTVHAVVSRDHGQTWSAPRDITAQVKPAHWGWYATGPCHGIQLSSGRLLVPCDMSLIMDDPGLMRERIYSHCVYSDDHGLTWRAGNPVGPGFNECAAAQRADGSVVLNMRNYNAPYRAVSISRDGGHTFGEARIDRALPDPVCQGSLLGLPGGALLFSNCASEKRARLTVRLSLDGGESWAASRLVHAGPSAYSDLAVAGDTVYVLYEKGLRHPYEQIAIAAFPLSLLWEASGA